VIRRLLLPSLVTAALLAVLLALGIWQVHRLAWKRGLLAQIDAAEQAPPVPLPPNPSPFIKVRARGRLLTDRLAYWGTELRDTRAGPLLGAQLIVPLQRAEGPPVLTDLGWVPTQPAPALDLPTGEVTVVGYVHPKAEPRWFTPANDPAKRQFYTLDPAAIGQGLGLPRVAPFTLIALGPAPPSGWPIPAQNLPRPPNDHLQYAITWFSLAAVLLVIFALYARKALRHES
jgi:surfeit locus 1 family protein